MGTSTDIISNYLGTRALKHMLGIPSQEFTMPRYIYLTLYSSLEGAGNGDTGVEITKGIGEFSRPEIDIDSGDLTIDGLYIYNTFPIHFAQAETTWEIVRGWGLKDSSYQGNLLFWGMLDVPTSNPIGNTIKVPARGLEMIFSQGNIVPSRGGWTTFSSMEMVNWIVNGTSFDWLRSGGYIALGRNVIENNSTDHLFVSWTEIDTLICPSYSRKFVTYSDWTTPINGVTSNINSIIFTDNTTESWGSVTDVVIYDSLGINPIFWGHLDNEVIISKGDGFRFSPGTLPITIR